ncbi:hypothetical protein K435DRAFT_785403 [Dendrothele bispora CBS 962.96]|uniref:Uncharacterized protein n=1 Tax=Dendrothele bispora (strain CBS 962.96) TaxID=1314807 RepID=A0A4S8KWZ7_DENBC|nr:hypothetical protein K435DRAFT_785403 [Dendrothele bispora CBS 962.96]
MPRRTGNIQEMKLISLFIGPMIVISIVAPLQLPDFYTLSVIRGILSLLVPKPSQEISGGQRVEHDYTSLSPGI